MRTWRDVPGWFDFQDIYDEAIADVLRCPHALACGGPHFARFVEVGVGFGRSAIYMAEKIRAAKWSTYDPEVRVIEFDAIDSWTPDHVPGGEHLRALADAFGGVRAAFEWYAAECGVREWVRPIQADHAAPEVLARYAPASLDLVFLDTCHTEAGTRAAISAWLPKVRPGGIFAGHDFTPQWPGVVAAVRDVLPEAVRRRSSFFWRVPAP